MAENHRHHDRHATQAGDEQQRALFDLMVDDAIAEAERRLADEKQRAARRALQLAREQAYHRLALEIDRPQRTRRSGAGRGQLSFFPSSDPTLFDPEPTE